MTATSRGFILDARTDARSPWPPPRLRHNGSRGHPMARYLGTRRACFGCSPAALFRFAEADPLAIDDLAPMFQRVLNDAEMAQTTKPESHAPVARIEILLLRPLPELPSARERFVRRARVHENRVDVDNRARIALDPNL